MTDTDTTRYVRNRTSAEVFVKGYGVVPGDFEGDLPTSDAVSHLIGANVFADVRRPDERLTAKQQAAQEAADLGIEFDYDSVTETQLRQMITDKKEGGS